MRPIDSFRNGGTPPKVSFNTKPKVPLSGSIKIILLTGLVASGKSTFALELKKKGFEIIDADFVTNTLYQEKAEIFRQVTQAFAGHDILTDGKIDKKKLGNIVFSDANLFKSLTDIMYPADKERIEQMIRELSFRGKKMVVVMAANGYEAGLGKISDEVWIVDTPRRIALPAFLNRSASNSVDRFERIRRFQTPRSRLLKIANRVFRNNREVEMFSLWADQLAEEYKPLLTQPE